MGSILDKWFGFNPPAMPEKPPPAAVAETGGDEYDAMKRGRKRKGYANTLLTGMLEPMDTGKKTLLG
jgi:hypothetical protein